MTLKSPRLNLIPVLLLIACTTIAGQTSGEAYSAKIKSIIDKYNAEIVEAYANGDIDKAASHFAADAIQMPPNQPALIGNDAYKEAWKQNVQFGKWTFDLEAVEVRAVDNIAVERGKYTLKFEPKPGSPIPPIDDRGNYVVLWEKLDDEWKIVWDAPVSELPPMPSPGNN